MGQKSSTTILHRVITLTLPYSDYDKLIYYQYEYIKGILKRKDLKNHIPSINIDYLTDIKTHEKKSASFISWYNIWEQYDEEKKLNLINQTAHTPLLSFKIPTNGLSFSLNHLIINPNNHSSISECEKALRKYYIITPKSFKEKVFSGPPSSFRWLSWLISADVPTERIIKSYQSLNKYKLKPDIEIQINKDISRTMSENGISIPELHDPLFRILKSLALLDPEMSYCQGMNFICAFMLLLSDGNEIDTFYLLMALFSDTFNSNFSIRGFFIELFPKLNFFAFVFDHFLQAKIPTVHDHFNSIDLLPQCWINKWFQTLYVHIFPIEATIRIWDGIFAYGIPFIISVALSLITIYQKELLLTNDIVEVVDFFHRLNTKHFNIKEKQLDYDIDKVIQLAKEQYLITNEELWLIWEIYAKKKEEDYFENDDDKDKDKEIDDSEAETIIVRIKTRQKQKMYKKYDYLNVYEKQFIVDDKEMMMINGYMKDVEREIKGKNIKMNINNTIRFNNPFIKK